MTAFFALSSLGAIGAAFLLGILSGLFTAYGAFIVFAICAEVFARLTGRALTRVGKFVLAVVIGIACGAGGVLAPLIMGVWMATNVAGQSRMSVEEQVAFFLPYIGTLVYWLLMYLRAYSK